MKNDTTCYVKSNIGPYDKIVNKSNRDEWLTKLPYCTSLCIHPLRETDMFCKLAIMSALY